MGAVPEVKTCVPSNIEPGCKHGELVLFDPVSYDLGASLEVRLTVDRGSLNVKHVQRAIEFLELAIKQAWVNDSDPCAEPCAVSS